MEIKEGEAYKCMVDIIGADKVPVFTEGRVYVAIGSDLLIDDFGEKRLIANTGGRFIALERVRYKTPITSLPSEYNEIETDPINPKHYKSYSVETIDMMIAIYGKEKVAIHCELTAFKYRMRAGKKGDFDECIAKEKWYLDKGKELRNG